MNKGDSVLVGPEKNIRASGGAVQGWSSQLRLLLILRSTVLGGLRQHEPRDVSGTLRCVRDFVRNRNPELMLKMDLEAE